MQRPTCMTCRRGGQESSWVRVPIGSNEFRWVDKSFTCPGVRRLLQLTQESCVVKETLQNLAAMSWQSDIIKTHDHLACNCCHIASSSSSNQQLHLSRARAWYQVCRGGHTRSPGHPRPALHTVISHAERRDVAGTRRTSFVVGFIICPRFAYEPSPSSTCPQRLSKTIHEYQENIMQLDTKLQTT